MPGWKTITIEETPGSDSDRIMSTPSTPLSRSSSRGTVISCSTSSAERPSASVWTSAYGGLNSGNASMTCIAQLHNANGQEADGGRQDQEAELHNTC